MKRSLLLLVVSFFVGGIASAQIGAIQRLSEITTVESTDMQASDYRLIQSKSIGNVGLGASYTVSRPGVQIDDTLMRAVNGEEVEFRVPSDSVIASICSTPRPYVLGTNRDPSCSYVVPCDNPANRDGVNTSTIDYYQLVWHVMTDGGPSTNINQLRIDQLMTELNSDFGTANMIFCSDPATFYEDAVNYTHDSNTEEFSLKGTYNVTPTQVINIYVVGTMSAGGYARFPYDPNGGTSANGGIVLNRGNCNVGTHTLAHEMGHVFGLEHTFAGVDERTECSNCYEKVRNVNGSSNTTGVPTPLGGPYANEGDREGDWCSDTNPHDTYAYNCSTSPNSNGVCDAFSWANAPVNNHMSYSFCSSQFTDQQIRRMHCMTDSYLASWIGYGGGICGSQPPAADFVGTPTTWQAPSTVNFTDLSTPPSIITGWTWNFDTAGSGTVTCVGCVGPTATFVGQVPPTVNYPLVGLYTVSLDITSANGPDNETKLSYIEVLAPAGDCDTLSLYWDTPVSSPTWYNFGTGYLTGVQDPLNSTLPTDPKGMYERFFSPNPGTTPVGGVRVGLANLNDLDDDMVLQVVVYDDDGFGAPGALLGGAGGISPTQLGVPGYGFFQEFWIPFNVAPVPTTASFHVGVEIFAGDATDSLLVISSIDGQGLSAPGGRAHIFSTGFGYENIVTAYGIDIDLDIVPMLGEFAPDPLIIGFTENVVCDTTYVTIYDTMLYTAFPSAIGFEFSDGTVLSYTSDPGSVDVIYTTPGPDTVMIYAVNDCGRADTNIYVIPYNFMETPDAEFAAVEVNPICAGVPGVNFNANTSGYEDYTWDFGDGTTVSTGTASTTNHIYATPGLYYVSLTTTEFGFVPVDTFYLENFEGGWPAGYDRYDNDAFTPNVGVNPPFTGTDATAWLDLDADGSGDLEATSTSWNGPGEQGDDWMLTTGIGVLPANQMLFWDAEAQSANFPDGYEVRISTTQLPANTSNYSTVLFSNGGENSFITTRNTSLAGYAGQTVFIAFRNNSTDEFLLTIDNIRVGTAGPGCSAIITKPDYVQVVDCSVTAPTAVIASTAITGCVPHTVTFTDGTVAGDPATSWLWNFGDATFSTLQNPPPHLYATAGTYFVSFQACNVGGCTTDNVTVTVTAPPTIGSATTTDPSCIANNGSIVINASGGTGILNYSIDNGLTFQVSNIFPGLGAATYNIVVQDAVGCTANTTVVLSLPVSPTITGVSTTPPTCNGGSDGGLTITATGGLAPLNYSIDNGVTFQLGNSFGSLGAATYNIVVEDANGCQDVTTASVINPPAVTYGIVIGNENCGAVDGTITLTGAGGDGGPYTYSIDNGITFQASGSFTGLTAGPYNIVVEDASGCPVAGIETILGLGAPTIDLVITTNPTCVANTGTIVITASGGTGAINYSIDNGVTFQVSNTFTGLGAATYNIVIEDGLGCQAFTVEILVIPPSPTISGVTTTPPTCNGGLDGGLVITATGGFAPLNYSIDNGLIFQSGNSFGSLGAAIYNIVVEDANGCQATTTATVVDPPAVTYGIVIGDENCGAIDGSITLTGGGGDGGPYNYSIDNGFIFQLSGSFTGLSAGPYNVVVEDASGCPVSNIETVNGNGGATITGITEDVSLTCFGDCNGQLTAAVTGGIPTYVYAWVDGLSNPVGGSSATISGLCADTYTLTVTDDAGAGCDVVLSYVLTEPAQVTFNAVFTNESCALGNGSIVFNSEAGGDGGPYTYSIDNGLTFQASNTFTGLSAATYNVLIQDGTGCQSLVTVGAINNVLDIVLPSAICQNVTIYLDGAGNASIVAANIDAGSTDNCGAVTLGASQTVFTCADLGVNNITLTVTDGNSNIATCIAAVTVLDTISPVATCQPSTVFLDGAGNVTLLATAIDGGSTDNCTTVTFGASQTAFTCADLGPNSVTLTVTDGSGNTSNCIAVVTVADNAVPTALCQNVTVYLDGTGNTSIVAADIDGGSTDNCTAVALGASQTAFTCADIGANNVTLTATDGSTNTATCVALVTVLDTISPVITCPGNTTQNADANCDAALADYTGLATTSDVCDAAPVVTQLPAAGTLLNGSGAVQTVTLTSTDASGNATSCTFDVTVIDVTPPSTPVLPDVNGACSVTALPSAATDNCAGVIVGTTLDPTTYSTPGAYVVNWTFDDGNGNTTSAPQNVIVVGGETAGTISPVVCNSYTAPSGVIHLTSGTYMDTITNAAGCDSMITINLTLNTDQTSSYSVTQCLEYTLPSGSQTFYASTIFVDTIPSASGCDSIMTIDITIYTVNIGATQAGNTLTAEALAPATYQWVDCATGYSDVIGATSQSFIPNYNSDFAVIVFENGCYDTSACFTISTVDVNELFTENVAVYPNPTTGEFFISFSDFEGAVTIELTDITGKLIYHSLEDVSTDNNVKVSIDDVASGVYFVRVTSDNDMFSTRIVKD